MQTYFTLLDIRQHKMVYICFVSALVESMEVFIKASKPLQLLLVGLSVKKF